MALVQSQSTHRSASPYSSANSTEPVRPTATISPHSTSTTNRATDPATSQRNGKRSVSSGHVKMASAGGTRVPVPPLLGNAPPFLDGRNRVSSNPSRPVPPRSSSQPSFPNPQFQSRTISSSSVSPSATSPNNHQYAFPQSQSQYPYNQSAHSNGGMVGNGWNGAAPGGGGYGYLSPDQQHQAMLMQQAQFQQQQWQAEMMRGQPNQQYDWSQQAQNNSARRRATSGPAPSPPFHTTSHPPSPVPSFTQFPNGNVPSLPPGAMSPQSGNAYPTLPASLEGRDVGTAPRSVEGYHPYRRGGGKNENSSAGTVVASATSTTTAPMMQGGGSKSKGIQHGSSSSSSSNSNSSTPSHARTDSTASSSLSARNFPPLPKSTASTTTLQDPKSSSKDPLKISTAATTPRVTTTVPSPTKERSRTTSTSSTQRAENRERLSFIDTSSSSSTSRSSSPAPPTTSTPSPTSPTTTSSGSNTNSNSVIGGKKPSPLSQQVRGHTNSMETERGERPGTPGTYRRRDGSGGKESDEESDDTALQIVAPPLTASKDPERTVERVVEKEKKNGMKYKLKKAFSINSGLSGVADGGAGGKSVSMSMGRRGSTSSNETTGGPPRLSTHQLGNSTASLASTSTRPEGSRPPPPAGGSRRFGILNSKLNASTDNISISSTVSSASVMLRKIGQMGKLARRSSLMSLTKAFKSNSSTKDSESASVSGAPSSSKLVKKDRKSEAASASVSHATVELESPTQTPSSIGSMSPAAALAKKHQLQYAEQEANAAALAARSSSPITRFDVHARTGSSGSISNGVAGVGAGKGGVMEEDGKKDKSKGKKKWGFGSLSSSSSKRDLSVDQEGDDKRSITGSVSSASGSGIGRRGSFDNLASGMGGRDEIYEDGPGEIEFVRLENGAPGEEERFTVVPPAPRRDARPTRGILKGARSYNQEDYALPRPAFPRNRANSADNATQLRASPTSLQSPLSAFEGAIPNKDNAPIIISSPSASVTKFPTTSPNDPPPSSPYLNQTQNYSAPVLHSQYPLLPPNPRSSTLPSLGRKITFAANLSVHTTWPAEVYDRRAEPAACNRLTPAFAQRIKEELNAYKMEEMEVHQSSRQLTHFFV